MYEHFGKLAICKQGLQAMHEHAWVFCTSKHGSSSPSFALKRSTADCCDCQSDPCLCHDLDPLYLCQRG